MPEHHLLPIGLPRGRIGNKGFITVYFAPRLKVRGALETYTPWTNWPDALARFNVGLDITDGANVERVTPRVSGTQPSADCWSAVFAPKTPVNPHRYTDWSNTPIQPMANSTFNESVLDLYTQVAADFPVKPPDNESLQNLPVTQSVFRSGAGSVEEAMDYLAPMGDVDGTEKEPARIDEPRDPLWDFHAHVSLLGAHPEVLRLLGLAVDYEFDFPPSLGDPLSVTVATDYQSVFRAHDAFALWITTHTTEEFQALPNPDPIFSEQINGFLGLRNHPDTSVKDAYLSILDSYAAATRLNSMDVAAANTDVPVDTEREAPLPALITRALSLVRPNLLPAFRNRTQRQLLIESAVDDQLGELAQMLIPQSRVEVFAEDVSIGHRIDVLHQNDETGGEWLSLFDRQTTEPGYSFPLDETQNVVPSADEGWTQTVLVTEIAEVLEAPSDDNKTPIEPAAVRRLDDQLYRWDGWSGAVRPPGAALDGDTGGLGMINPELPVNDPEPARVQFAATYTLVPETLPRLRFGETYRMRARCVDLAGNSQPLSAQAHEHAISEQEVFGRLEPIGAPFIVRREPRPTPGIGDEATTMVLLSDWNTNDADVAPQERLLFPARVGQDLCELHGEPSGGADRHSYALLAARDASSPEAQWSRDTQTDEAIAPGDAHQDVAYLADPLAGALRAYRANRAEEHLLQPTTSWPELTSLRIELVAGENPTEVQPDSETDLRLSLSKADIETVDLSYAPRDGDVGCFGLWHRLSAEQKDLLRSRIANGGHWMFSAPSSLRLVYAVRRPLLAPLVTLWQATRAPGSTGIRLDNTELQTDRRSTGRLALRAYWIDEAVDDTSQPEPGPRAGGARLGSFNLPRTVGETYTIDQHRAELGDTRRHRATIDVEAFSSFSDYFTELRVVLVKDGKAVIDARGISASSVQVRYRTGKVENVDNGVEQVATLNTDYTLDAAAGTLIVNKSGALMDSTELTVQYIPLPISRRSDEHPDVMITIPNTAVPPRPVVASVIPAFRRDAIDNFSVEHDGRTLRVYLERPWNRTGDGEQLAVLVPRMPGIARNGTRLGRDPVYLDNEALTPLSAGQFTSAARIISTGLMDLALHDVNFDIERRQWRVDITLDTDQYRPFVQLVVARYQADSISERQLGPSVTLEPVRLGVSRIAKLSEDGDGYEVRVSGVDHDGLPSVDENIGPIHNEITVSLQSAHDNIADADLRWLSTDAVIALQRTTSGEETVWMGHIQVANSDVPQRLLIEESEPAHFGGVEPQAVGTVVYSEVLLLPRN